MLIFKFLTYIFYFNSKNKKLNKTPIDFQISGEKQINLFNYDIKSFQIEILLFSNSTERLKTIKLDSNEEIYSSSSNTAIKVKETLKGEQKLIDIFAPFIIFNRTNEKNPISFSLSDFDESFKIKKNDSILHGLQSNDEKTMELDISLKDHKKVDIT